MAPSRTPQAAVAAAVEPFAARLRRPALGALLPSGRSLACGFTIVALVAGGYLGARSTGVFAVQRIEVRGLTAPDAAEARSALADLEGRSLVGLRRAELERRLAAVPGLLSFEHDRAFPHTLIVRARPEVPVAVLRRGAASWLVSRRGRVLRRVPRGAVPSLPRIWTTGGTAVAPGITLAAEAGGAAAEALARLAAVDFPAPARGVRIRGELTYVLRSGLEIRLGTPAAADLKLAVAAEIVPLLDSAVAYLDVRVPSRPVAGDNPQLADRG